jgi:hypothetical protein
MTYGGDSASPREFVLRSAAARTVLAAIGAGRRVAALSVDGSAPELLSFKFDALTGELALTFDRAEPSPGSTPCQLLHVMIDGQHL